MKNKIADFLYDFLVFWKKLRIVCHFLPLTSTIAWLLYWALEPSRMLFYSLIAPLLLLGWCAALIARPVQFFKIVIGFTVAAGSFGWGICPFFPLCIVTAVMGLYLGLNLSVGAVVVAPAAITLYCFIKDYVLDNGEEPQVW